MFNYIEYQESQNLCPTEIKDKESYYSDLNNIDWGMTGRIEVMFANSFFYEAVQLIRNSIVLFEKGYFDCAFYSLRQSLEISTTSIYFADETDNENRDAKMKDWKKQNKFPQQGQMINQMINRKSDFADIRAKMSAFFDDLEITKAKLNKHVHKQGMDKFYTYRGEHFTQVRKARHNDFVSYLEKSIGAIAVMRLVIDPMPLLLLDEEIYARTIQTITENYSSAFIEKYIGETHISAYKESDIYKGYYDSLMVNEKMLPSVLTLVKDNFISRNDMEEIMSQIHLLSVNDRVAIAMANLLKGLVNVYCYGGMLWYICDTKRKMPKTSFSSAEFEPFVGKANSFNHEFHGAFLSVLSVHDEEYYLEHNDELSSEELALIDLFFKMLKIKMS